MCPRATVRFVIAAALLAAFTWSAKAQPVSLDCRHIGNSAIELSMPSVTTGPVNRVWYSQDASTLYTQTVSGRIFTTTDFEQWKQVQGQSVVPPAPANLEAVTVPESGLKLRSQPAGSSRFYGVGNNAYRSDDGGVTWTNLTAYKAPQSWAMGWRTWRFPRASPMRWWWRRTPEFGGRWMAASPGPA